MDRKDFHEALCQLAAAAELIAAGVSANEKITAYQMRAFFRLHQAQAAEGNVRHTVSRSTSPLLVTVAPSCEIVVLLPEPS
jgi:hypothetical protein